MEEIRTRFAPSPTGFMHIGNLRTCLYAYLFAKGNNGKFILRIEDTDRERMVEGAVDVIYLTLAAAGIQHDEGPDVGGAFGPYIQSERKDIYLKYAQELIRLGGAYYCFCDKERLSGLKDEKGIAKYDKHCLSLSDDEIQEKLANGDPYVIRQNIPVEGVSEYDDMVFGHISVPCADMEDNILIKSDGMPTYNFANVVDDHTMRISHVIRGMEYLSSTPKYNLIYDAFSWQRPKYIHLPPIMKDETRKLSKRHGDANFEDFLAKGYLEEAIVNYIALLGWSPKNDLEKMTVEEMVSLFSVEGLNRSGSIFDEVKMKWLNGEYIKQMSPQTFAARAHSFLAQSEAGKRYDHLLLAKLLIPRVEIFSEIAEKIDFLAEYLPFDAALYEHKKSKNTPESAKTILKAAIPVLEKLSVWTNDALMETISALAEQLEMKKAQLYWSIRIAVSGKEVTPGGASELCEILGKEESLRRLRLAYADLIEK